MKIEDVRTYVIHCKSLVDRRLLMEKQLNEQGFKNVSWFLDYDGDELDQETVDKWYTTKFWYDRFHPEFYKGIVAQPRVLGLGSISLVIKHAHVFEQIANGDDDYALVLEDDVLFNDNFKDLEFYMKDTPTSWDMIFIGSCCNLRVPNPETGKYFYRKESPSTKCTDSFFVSKDAAEKLAKDLRRFSLTIDFELNYHLHSHDMNVYWLEPPVTRQGSEAGLFESTGKP